MSLAPGATLGSYEILAPIGAGGMGEVYRARDTSLGRDVAIKVLPPAWLADAQRQARFAREARVLASLNHPNIAAIYGLAEDSGVRGLVLELVEGPTLADRIAGGPLSLKDALTIARQIAEGLEAAHDKGIVHRDLKPANVKVTPAGVVKVLDFGLAKVVDAEAADQAPTATSAHTGPGVVLGTAAYMSPEQARGHQVDKRTDTWAFGCVLYEMLTGRRAFAGATVSDTIAAILSREPDWSALPASTPAGIRRVLVRCLEKDPARRLREVGDSRFEIDEALGDSGPELQAALGTTRIERPRRIVPLVGIAAIIVAALGAAWWFWPATNRGGGTLESAAGRYRLTRLTFEPGLQTDAAISPDGQFVAYASDQSGNFDVYVKPTSGGNAVRVTDDTAHDWQPHWSSKNQLVFRSERAGGGLFVMPPTGGVQTKLTNFGHRPLWSPDGSRVLFSARPYANNSGVFIVGTDGRPARAADISGLLPRERSAMGWHPDGQRVVFLGGSALGGAPLSLFLLESDTGRAERLVVQESVQRTFLELGLAVHEGEPLVWIPERQAIYFIGATQGVSDVWSIELDREASAVSAGPHRVTTLAARGTRMTMSRNGVLAFAVANQSTSIWSYPLDASGRISGDARLLTAPDMNAVDPDLSADGRSLIFSFNRTGGVNRNELRERSLVNGSERTLLVSDWDRGEIRSQSKVSPDGSRVVYRHISPETVVPDNTVRIGAPQRLMMLDTRTGDESALTSVATGYELPGGWSPDGRFVVSVGARGRYHANLFGLALLPVSAAPAAQTQATVVTTSASTLWQPTMSPNGRWVAFIAGGTSRVAVVGSADGRWDVPESAWRYATDGAFPEDKPRWSADGRVLYFISSRGGQFTSHFNVWAVSFDPDTGDAGQPFMVTTFDGPGEQLPPDQIAGLEISVGPSQLLMPLVHPTGGIWTLTPLGE